MSDSSQPGKRQRHESFPTIRSVHGSLSLARVREWDGRAHPGGLGSNVSKWLCPPPPRRERAARDGVLVLHGAAHSGMGGAGRATLDTMNDDAQISSRIGSSRSSRYWGRPLWSGMVAA